MSDDDTVDSPPGNNVGQNGHTHTPEGKFAPGNGIGHRFAKGNRHGRGNPIAIRMHEGRMKFLDALGEGTLPELARTLEAAALGGDLEATKLLLGYALGRPQQAVELIGPDGGPLGRPLELDLSVLTDDELESLGRIARKIDESARAGQGVE